MAIAQNCIIWNFFYHLLSNQLYAHMGSMTFSKWQLLGSLDLLMLVTRTSTLKKQKKRTQRQQHTT